MTDTKSSIEGEDRLSLESSGSDFTPVNKPGIKSESASPTPTPTPRVSEAPDSPSKKAAKPKKAATPKTSKTPKEPRAAKKAATPKSKATPAKRAAHHDEDDEEEPTPKSAKRTKGGPSNDRKTIPATRDELSEEDKMMLRWKEEGKPWPVINAEWERLTGDKPGRSTLPNRYSRIKAAITTVVDADIPQMIESIKAVDAMIDAEHKEALAKKWARVAKHMRENGVDTEYAPATVEKASKKAPSLVKVAAPAVESGADSDDDEAGHEAAVKAKDESGASRDSSSVAEAAKHVLHAAKEEGDSEI